MVTAARDGITTIATLAACRAAVLPAVPRLLPELVPTLVYVTLAPFLDAEDAYEVAIG
jgi:hypothetical protein